MTSAVQTSISISNEGPSSKTTAPLVQRDAIRKISDTDSSSFNEVAQIAKKTVPNKEDSSNSTEKDIIAKYLLEDANAKYLRSLYAIDPSLVDRMLSNFA